MHDIKWIRDNPDAFDAALKKRGVDEVNAQSVLALDEQKRHAQTQLQALQKERNDKSKQIGIAKGKGENADDIIARVGEIKAEMAELEASLENDAITAMLESLPNILADDVPQGNDEADNVELRSYGEKPVLEFDAKLHFELGEALGMMDFDTAAKMSGSRFVLLSGELARLERALAQFMLDMHTSEFGYTETNPPFLVRDNAMYGTGQLPKFAEDSFKTTNDYWLIPTAEVTLTNIVADSILEHDQLPRRFTAHTPCFRSEAGAAGKDTRGMFRQHQFSKVELVSVVHPDTSKDEHERMTACAEEVLKRLGLHYRVMVLCSGDTGFSAQKTYDIEVWLPGQKAYREISSCSNCGAFQARRMKARYRDENGKPQFVHTLNGSGLAIGRTLIAVLENYQQADGSIIVPDVLIPYMQGQTRITATR